MVAGFKSTIPQILIFLALLVATSGCFTQLGRVPDQRTERSEVEGSKSEQLADSRLFATTFTGGPLRARPNADAFVLSEVGPGVQVEVIGAEGVYLYVQYKTRTGYLLQSHLEMAEDLKAFIRSGSAKVARDERLPRRAEKPKNSGRTSRIGSNHGGLTFGVGGGRAIFEGRTRGFGALNSGFVLRRAVFIITAEAEMDMTSSDEEGNPRYYWDSSVDRCRDSSNGQFARSGLCGSAAMAFFFTTTVDANIATGNGLYGGMGIRLGEQAAPYVSLGYVTSPPSSSSMRLSADVWASYLSIAIRFYAPF